MEDSKFDEPRNILQSHCQKNNAVNTMEDSKIPMHALIFICGWEANSIHNIFSYILISLSNHMRCGKNISHWFFKQSNEIYGGVPPTLDDIKIEPDLVSLFVDSMFFHRTQLNRLALLDRKSASLSL